jgi:hypothetical protein
MHSIQRYSTWPEQAKEIRNLREVLLFVKNAYNGSESVRSQAHKMVCEALDTSTSPSGPGRTRPARERYSLWREPRAKRTPAAELER